jgi:cephalosporin hydroxylase
MSVVSTLKKMAPKFVSDYVSKRWGSPNSSMENFAFAADGNARADITEKYGYSGDLLDIFADNKGQLVHKWHHYIPIYDRYFAAYRGKKVRFLELGVSKGGSLNLWRKYFGEDAIIFGIDIDPECKQYDGISGQVRIGSQDDPEFLSKTVAEMGGVDIILDDGSHMMPHVHASMEILFPLLSTGGIYMIEDLHTAYWRMFGGGYQSKSNFFNTVNELSHDMHRWYHSQPMAYPAISPECGSIHIHDSLVVLEKSLPHKPVHSMVV